MANFFLMGVVLVSVGRRTVPLFLGSWRKLRGGEGGLTLQGGRGKLVGTFAGGQHGTLGLQLEDDITHCPLGDVAVISRVEMSNTNWWVDILSMQ